MPKDEGLGALPGGAGLGVDGLKSGEELGLPLAPGGAAVLGLGGVEVVFEDVDEAAVPNGKLMALSWSSWSLLEAMN